MMTQENWYDENYFCSQYVDDTAVFLEIGGCKYDFPMGDCMDIPVDASDTMRGCAFELEAHMANKVRGREGLRIIPLMCLENQLGVHPTKSEAHTERGCESISKHSVDEAGHILLSFVGFVLYCDNRSNYSAIRGQYRTPNARKPQSPIASTLTHVGRQTLMIAARRCFDLMRPNHRGSVGAT